MIPRRRLPSRRAPLSLVIGVKRRLSRRNDPRAAEANAEFERQRMAILKRDKWQCQCCGFASRQIEGAPSGGLEIHHVDDDHHNNDPSNLVTLCPFCHMVFTAGRRGLTDSASIGLAPLVSQEAINRIHHVIFGLKKMREHQLSDKASLSEEQAQAIKTIDKAFDALSAWRFQAVEDARAVLEYKLGLPEITNPAVLHDVLAGLKPDQYEKRHLFLDGVRLFPQIERFSQETRLWSEHVWWSRYPPQSWGPLAESVSKFIDQAVRDSRRDAA